MNRRSLLCKYEEDDKAWLIDTVRFIHTMLQQYT